MYVCGPTQRLWFFVCQLFNALIVNALKMTKTMKYAYYYLILFISRDTYRRKRICVKLKCKSLYTKSFLSKEQWIKWKYTVKCVCDNQFIITFTITNRYIFNMAAFHICENVIDLNLNNRITMFFRGWAWNLWLKAILNLTSRPKFYCRNRTRRFKTFGKHV